jgi:hypothetical protein
MKKLLIATLPLLLIASTASAQFFRVVSDPVNQECYLGPAGSNDHAAIIMKFTAGTTGARFKIHVPPGSGIFSVSSPYTMAGDFTNLTISYGTCLFGTGPFVIATFVSTLVEGSAEVWPAEGETGIIVTDCAFQQVCCGSSYGTIIGPNPPSEGCGIPLATESSTWGAVKALYR